MKIDKLNSWLSVIANFGVLIGIIFLAVELNQNKISQNVSTKQEMTRQFSDFVDLLLLNPELREINGKGMRGDVLDQEETAVFNLILNKGTWYFASMHYQFESQSLSEEEWAQSRNLIANYCSSSGYAAWWENNREAYSPSFTDYMDGLCL